MIKWKRFDPYDQRTHPECGEVVLVMCLKGGKARIYTEAVLDAWCVWRVVVRDKSFKQKGVTELGDYDFGSLAWAKVNLPSWWRSKNEVS